MGISTQRLLVMIVAINLIISISYAIYETPRIVDYGVYGETISLGETSASQVESETSNVFPDNLQVEGSYTNALRMGSVIFKIFIRGLAPFPFMTQGLASGQLQTLVTMLAWALQIFQSITYMIIIVEIYMIFKNKKQS